MICEKVFRGRSQTRHFSSATAEAVRGHANRRATSPNVSPGFLTATDFSSSSSSFTSLDPSPPLAVIAKPSPLCSAFGSLTTTLVPFTRMSTEPFSRKYRLSLFSGALPCVRMKSPLKNSWLNMASTTICRTSASMSSKRKFLRRPLLMASSTALFLSIFSTVSTTPPCLNFSIRSEADVRRSAIFCRVPSCENPRRRVSRRPSPPCSPSFP